MQERRRGFSVILRIAESSIGCSNAVMIAASVDGNTQSRLLLADDNGDMLDQVQSLLQPEFKVVAAVKDGAALVAASSALRPDAVITDLGMPVLGGIEAGREILRRGSCSCIVLLTMYSEAELVNRALQAGVLGYVLKTDAAEELVPAVRNALRNIRYLSRGVRRLAHGDNAGAP